MFDFFSDLPAWCRLTISAIVLTVGISLATWGATHGPKFETHPLSDGREMMIETSAEPGARAALRVGMVVTGVGAVLLLLSSKSSAEKAGYHF